MSWIEKWLGSNVTYDLAWLEKWLWKMAVDVCCCSRKFTAEFSYGGASRVYMRINDPTATVTKLFGAAEEPTALPPSLATLKPAWDHPPKKSLKSPQLFWPSGGRRVSFIQKFLFHSLPFLSQSHRKWVDFVKVWSIFTTWPNIAMKISHGIFKHEIRFCSSS